MLKHQSKGRRMIEPLESRFLLSAAQMIRNGGFEGVVSSADWVLAGNFQADSRFTNVHTGAGYAYLADAAGNAGNSLSGSLYQQLTLPSTATSLTLNFWTKITTSETTTTAANDVMTIRVLNSTGTTVLQSLTTYSNLNASSSYVQRTFSLSRSLIGQTVRIQFDASTDATLATTFRVDDVSLNAVSPATKNRVVGYLPNYSYSAFSKLDLTALTHVNYFSVSIASANDGTLSTGGVTSANLDAAVAALHAVGATVSITVGPVSFTTLAASATARAAFATNIVNYALAHNLDGIDIDWEPPAGNNVTNYGLLISDLYTVAHPQHMLITAAVNPWTNEIPAAAVNSYMDWLNVMCYDFSYANHSTYSDAVSGMVDWTNYGVQKNKIVMGVPFYGRTGTSWSNTSSKTYTSIINDYVATYGTYPSLDADSYVSSGGSTYYFNGVTTIEKKAAYVRDNGYGGMMIWELSQDHWDSSNHYDQYSLLPVIKSMMNPPAWLTPASGSRFDLVAGTLYIHAGTVTLSSDASATNANLNVSVAGSTSLLLGSTQHLGVLTIANLGSVTINAGGDKTLVVTSLSVGSTGKLDLKNNSMIVNYTGASPAATIVPLLASGRNGGAWTGNGIISSTAGADGSRITGIGYAEASALGRTTFAGQAVDSTALLLKYTYYGDTLLDGSVDADDLARTDRGSAMHQTTWTGGDYDYNGTVTAADYALIDKAFAAHGPVIQEPQFVPDATEPTGIMTEPVVAVAEPAGDESATLASAVIAADPVVTIDFSSLTQGRAKKAMTFRIVLPPTVTQSRRYGIDWDGDGKVDQVVTGKPGAVLRVKHTYRKAGTYTPTVYALPSAGKQPQAGAAVSQSLSIEVT